MYESVLDMTNRIRSLRSNKLNYTAVLLFFTNAVFIGLTWALAVFLLLVDPLSLSNHAGRSSHQARGGSTLPFTTSSNQTFTVWSLKILTTLYLTYLTW